MLRDSEIIQPIYCFAVEARYSTAAISWLHNKAFEACSPSLQHAQPFFCWLPIFPQGRVKLCWKSAPPPPGPFPLLLVPSTYPRCPTSPLLLWCHSLNKAFTVCCRASPRLRINIFFSTFSVSSSAPPFVNCALLFMSLRPDHSLHMPLLLTCFLSSSCYMLLRPSPTIWSGALWAEGK